MKKEEDKEGFHTEEFPQLIDSLTPSGVKLIREGVWKGVAIYLIR